MWRRNWWWLEVVVFHAAGLAALIGLLALLAYLWPCPFGVC
jgi:hypothetical protein